MSKNILLKIVNLSIKNKKNLPPILNNINLEIIDNDIIAVIGKSGSGKTTLLNSILFNKIFLNGHIELCGQKINNKKTNEVKKIRKITSYMSQTNTLIDDITIYDNLKLFLSNKNNILYNFLNLITKKQEENIFNILNMIDMNNYAFYKISELSGGQKQKIEISKILMQNSKIILLDEPTSNLDKKNAKNMINLIVNFAKKSNSTVIANIHDISLLKNHFNRVIGIKNGSIFFDKKTKFLTKKNIKDLYE